MSFTLVVTVIKLEIYLCMDFCMVPFLPLPVYFCTRLTMEWQQMWFVFKIII